MNHLLALSINGQQVQTPGGLQNTSNVTISSLIFFGINMLIFAAIALASIFLVVSGVQWIMSGGDKQKIESARKRITLIVTGLIIVLGAVLILNLVGGVFGINFMQVQFPS